MITFEKVVFGYDRRRKVFPDLTLTLGEGHIHGLLGRNGIGKSTLLRLACGVLAPEAGRIAVDGFTPSRRSVEGLERLMFVPEELILPDISLRRLAALTGPFYPGYSSEEFESHCAALEIDPAQRPSRMSKGETRKGYLAFALACNTPVLLLDEPTEGLDIPSKTALRGLLAAWADQRRTVVIATHQVREVETLIDSVTILDAEGVALAATTEELGRRLRFGTFSETAQPLYSTPSLAGRAGIAANTSGEECRPDLELLFAAVLSDRTVLTNLLHPESARHE